jgi:glycosyltransferase involved in cell wall biosynthesis
MRVVVAKILEFPSKGAHLIYNLNQGWELARMGCEVVYWLRPLESLTLSRIAYELGDYGLKPLPGLHFRILYFTNKPLASLEFRIRLLAELLRPGKKVIFIPANLRSGHQLVLLKRWIRLDPPLVYEVHNLDHVIQENRGESGHRRTRKQEASVYANVDGLVVISEPLFTVMRKQFNALCRHIVILPEGVRPELFGRHGLSYEPPRALGSHDPVTVVYAGSFYHFKGVHLLLESLRFLPERVRLRLIGDRPREIFEELKRKACEWGVDHRVDFVGYVPHAAIGRELVRADMLALPLAADDRSIHFTSPIKLFEYLYAGRPLIVTDFPSTRSILGNEEACLFVDHPSPQAFAKAVSYLLDHPAVARQMAQRARKIGEGYTWHARAVRLQAFFESLSKSKKTE